jgi:hypothetical protein
MRSLLTKFALSTAVIAGGVIAAQACPQRTVLNDTGPAASFQLAQASGGSGGTGGAGGTAGAGGSTSTDGSSGGSGTGAGSTGTGTQSPGTTSGSGQSDWPKKDTSGATGSSPQPPK